MAFVHREFSQANPESQPAQVVPILYTAWSFTLPSSTKLQTTMDILLSSFSLYRVQVLHIALLHKVADHNGHSAVILLLVQGPAATHFVGLSPGCLCEVSNVDIVICPYFVFTDEGLEVLGGGVLVRAKPELDNLDHIFHAELLVLMSGHLELVNDLGERNILSSEQDFPVGLDVTNALRCPELGQLGQLLVPCDLPHVGRGGDAVRDQGPRGNKPTVLINLLDEFVLVGFTQNTIDDVASEVWSRVETLGVFWVQGTVVRLGGYTANVWLRLPAIWIEIKVAVGGVGRGAVEVQSIVIIGGHQQGARLVRRREEGVGIDA